MVVTLCSRQVVRRVRHESVSAISVQGRAGRCSTCRNHLSAFTQPRAVLYTNGETLWCSQSGLTEPPYVSMRLKENSEASLCQRMENGSWLLTTRAVCFASRFVRELDLRSAPRTSRILPDSQSPTTVVTFTQLNLKQS